MIIGSAVFDTDYARWLDDDHGHMSELRTALQAHLSDGDLRLIVDGYIAHYDEIFRLKQDAVKSDVFHLITGMWATPAERCFLWIGGFRPSDLIKVWFFELLINVFAYFAVFVVLILILRSMFSRLDVNSAIRPVNRTTVCGDIRSPAVITAGRGGSLQRTGTITAISN